MNRMDMVYCLMIEPMKYLVISYGILGFPVRKGWGKYCFLAYPIVGYFLMKYMGVGAFEMQSLASLVVLIGVFQGTYWKKLQAFVLEWFFVAILDGWNLSLLIFIFSDTLEPSSRMLSYITNTIGLCIFTMVAVIIRNQKGKIYQYFQELSNFYFGITFLLLCTSTINTGLVEGMILEPHMFLTKSERVQNTSLIALLLTNILCIIFIIILVYNVISKNHMKLENDLKEELWEYQKKYYINQIHKDYGMRSFRHDFQKNMAIMQVLAENNEYHRLKEFIVAMNHEYQSNKMIYSGNTIADYFINTTVEELKEKEDLHFEITGQFPTQLPMTDIDFSILFGNAMDNAKEALFCVHENPELFIHIHRQGQHLFVQICNSSDEKKDDLLESQKKDVKNHGIGTMNMKRVVEKYGGEIKWSYDNGIFTTEIFI